MNNNGEKFLIMTNIDGFAFANYTTEKTLSYSEAVKVLQEVKGADPNAKIVKVSEIVEG
ncbi:MAG: hypothetical protein SPL86_01190 [Succiniclasticum sp.]|uniref:hypothetical protein n=1 Tax=Succiniclasticum sp. TaxID=2775030 RepID=UPI002A9124BC|nr:hypothetical protein [Succiniclasticum sp.]MDY6290081.1 hypothetical protein [Succiniclasticum sp.]